MRMISLNNEYSILSRLSDGRRYTALDRSGRPCLLVVENKAQEARRLTPMLQQWTQSEAFTDLYEFFPYQEGVAVVFAHRAGGKPLDTALCDMPYPQRADALRSLFALVLHKSLPPELVHGALSPENLLLTSQGTVELLYDLPRTGESVLHDTLQRLSGDCAAPELAHLAAVAADITISNYFDLYESAGLASDQLAVTVPQPAPRKRPFQVIAQRAQVVKAAVSQRVPSALAVTVIIAGYIAAGVLLYRTVIEPPRVDNGIRAIGTVVIENGS